jgi:hypothetical protein
MKQPDNSPDDLFDQMLGSTNCLQRDDGLRTALLSETLGVIRFRRRLKKCLLPVALVGCYLAGVTSAFLWRSGGAASPHLPIEQTAAAPVRLAPAASSSRTEPVDSANDRVVSASMNPIEALRRNADARLLEDGDVRGAVRGYMRVLKLASSEQRAISPGQDTWLMMALKESRTKEFQDDRTKNN